MVDHNDSVDRGIQQRVQLFTRTRGGHGRIGAWAAMQEIMHAGLRPRLYVCSATGDPETALKRTDQRVRQEKSTGVPCASPSQTRALLRSLPPVAALPTRTSQL